MTTIFDEYKIYRAYFINNERTTVQVDFVDPKSFSSETSEEDEIILIPYVLEAEEGNIGS